MNETDAVMNALPAITSALNTATMYMIIFMLGIFAGILYQMFANPLTRTQLKNLILKRFTGKMYLTVGIDTGKEILLKSVNASQAYAEEILDGAYLQHLPAIKWLNGSPFLMYPVDDTRPLVPAYTIKTAEGIIQPFNWKHADNLPGKQADPKMIGAGILRIKAVERKRAMLALSNDRTLQYITLVAAVVGALAVIYVALTLNGQAPTLETIGTQVNEIAAWVQSQTPKPPAPPSGG